MPCSPPAPRPAGTTRWVTSIANAVTGRLMKNTSRHEATSVSHPPSSGPTVLPNPATPMIKPPARPFLAVGSSA